MVETQQVNTTNVEFGILNETRIVEQRCWKMVVNLYVAQLQERAVGQPNGVDRVVVLIVFGGKARVKRRVGGLGCPAILEIILSDIRIVDQRTID